MCNLMTSAKAAAALHISEAKLHKLRMMGEIHHIDPGTGRDDIRFAQDDLDGYLEWAERAALQKFRDRLRTRMRAKYPTTNQSRARRRPRRRSACLSSGSRR